VPRHIAVPGEAGQLFQAECVCSPSM
jgi:hypothetical protein